jgi:hypothetical protein
MSCCSLTSALYTITYPPLNLTSITSSLQSLLQALSNQIAGLVTSMLNKLHGQPDSYDKKFVNLYAHHHALADVVTTEPSTSLAGLSELEPTASSEKQSPLKENVPSRSS